MKPFSPIIMPEVYRCHSVYYSILDIEWQQVKAQFETILQAV